MDTSVIEEGRLTAPKTSTSRARRGRLGPKFPTSRRASGSATTSVQVWTFDEGLAVQATAEASP
jgi:hypothetical protein